MERADIEVFLRNHIGNDEIHVITKDTDMKDREGKKPKSWCSTRKAEIPRASRRARRVTALTCEQGGHKSEIGSKTRKIHSFVQMNLLKLTLVASKSPVF